MPSFRIEGSFRYLKSLFHQLGLEPARTFTARANAFKVAAEQGFFPPINIYRGEWGINRFSEGELGLVNERANLRRAATWRREWRRGVWVTGDAWRRNAFRAQDKEEGGRAKLSMGGR